MDKLLKVFRMRLSNLERILYHYIYRKSPLQMSKADLARALGNEVWEIERAINGLKDAGLIEVKSTKHGDGNIYKIVREADNERCCGVF